MICGASVLQVEPQTNEQHFSQSVFLDDLAGIMTGAEAEQRSFPSSTSLTELPHDGVMGVEVEVGVTRVMRFESLGAASSSIAWRQAAIDTN